MKVPEPLEVQVPEVAPPPSAPAIVAVPSEQIVSAGPAFMVGAWLTVIVLVEVTAEHDAGALVVNVSVTVPLKLAAGV